MNYFSENKDLYTTIFTALKSLGVKVPKNKNFKSCVPKTKGKNGFLSETKIFGLSLSKQEWTYESDYPIPVFLAVSTAYLLKFLTTVGLFRKSGSITRQRNLRVKLENGESLEGSDPNDVASLLKQWLRELPEPLIPQHMHELFGRCQYLDNKEDCVSASLLTCLLLSPEHLHPLKHLLCFLKKCAEHCSENQMGANNLALMMAPNIFISKAESFTKPCNSSIQLHTSVIQLLIENAKHVGEVPQTAALQFSIVDGRGGSELDSPADILELNVLKSGKKLRSDLFSGIKKLVGQNTNPISSLKTCTPEMCWSSPKIPCRNLFLNDEENILSSLNSKDMPVFLNNRLRTGSNHTHRKSFGLLRRKDRKRQKSNKSSQTKRNPMMSKSSNFNTCIVNDRIDSTFQKCTDESEKISSIVECEQDELKLENKTTCRSDCILAKTTKELFYSSTPTSSRSCLPNPSHATSYWFQSDIETAGRFKVRPLKTLHINGENTNDQNPDEKVSLETNKLQHIDQLEFHSPNQDSNFGDLNCKHFSNRKISPIGCSLLDPPIRSCSKRILNNLDSYERIPKSELSNDQRNSNSELMKDIDTNYSPEQSDQNSVNKTKNTVCQIKSIDNICRNNSEKCSNIQRSKSVMVCKWRNDNNKNNLSTKAPKKTSRQSSLIRGKPNTIKSGLLNQYLNKTPNLEPNKDKLRCQIQTKAAFKFNSHIDISERDKHKYFSEQDISLILSSNNLNDSTPNDVPEIKPVILEKSKSNKDGIQLYSKNRRSYFKSKIPRLRHSLRSDSKEATEISPDDKQKHAKLRFSVSSPGYSRIPVLLKQKLSISNRKSSMNDSCFMTPNQTLFNSPDSMIWMSGTKYLSFNSPQEDDCFNKRESIALILKENPGHVQAKVQLYNAKVVKSFSSPIVTNRKNSLCEEPIKSRKALSVSDSCDSSSKRTNRRNRINTLLPTESPKLLIDKIPSPSISHALKEVTNINSSLKQSFSHNTTPIQEEIISKPSSIQNNYGVDLNKKLKRNSFSGQTQSKLYKKVSRSESSPNRPRPGKSLFRLIQEQPTPPKVTIEINNLHKGSTHSPQPVKKSSSSLSIHKLKCYEMTDEWECEL